MPINLIRVVNQQVVNNSILIDKVDRSQSNFTGYANKAKLPVYVPYSNPSDPSVKGYSDFVPTDEVLLSADSGTIKGLSDSGYVSFMVVSSALISTPTISAAANVPTDTTITGTVFLSVAPDVTYVYLTNLSGVTQKIPQSAFSTHTATSIVIPDSAVTIGTPGAGWTVKVMANSKNSNTFTL